MSKDAATAGRLNRVYLSIPGFLKKYETHMFMDPLSFEFIVEALISHSASEIVMQSWGEKPDRNVLDYAPEVLRKRIKFVDKERGALKLANNILLPVFAEYSVDYETYGGVGLVFNQQVDHVLTDAIADSWSYLCTFLLGLKYKLQVDIDINAFKKKVSMIRQKSKNPDSRANMSILEGMLNCYSPVMIDALVFMPHAVRGQEEVFQRFLEDSSFATLSKTCFRLGFPQYLNKSLIQVKRIIRQIVSSEKFGLLFNVASKYIQVATGIPLPDAGLIQSTMSSNYLPPIVSLDDILKEARAAWENQYGNSNLAERLQRLKSMIEIE